MILSNEELNIELNKIRGEFGELDPKRVVEVASDVNHPLHNFFEWDNDKAGSEHRIWQARQLITKVYKIIGEDVNQKVQVYYNVVREDGVQAYHDVDTIMSTESLKHQLINTAISEIEYWQTKYSQLVELAKVVDEQELSKARELNK